MYVSPPVMNIVPGMDGDFRPPVHRGGVKFDERYTVLQREMPCGPEPQSLTEIEGDSTLEEDHKVYWRVKRAENQRLYENFMYETRNCSFRKKYRVICSDFDIGLAYTGNDENFRILFHIEPFWLLGRMSVILKDGEWYNGMREPPVYRAFVRNVFDSVELFNNYVNGFVLSHEEPSVSEPAGPANARCSESWQVVEQLLRYV